MRADRAPRAGAAGRAKTSRSHVAAHAWVAPEPSIPFGPQFFATHLAAFVRDRCPAPTEALPVVLLHLVDGETLDVCHVIGLAASWVALAVHSEREGEEPRMRTDVVPYSAVLRVSLRAEARGGGSIGYRQEHEPQAFGGANSDLGTRAEGLFRGACRAPSRRSKRNS